MQGVVDALVAKGRERINRYYGEPRLAEKIKLYVHDKPVNELANYGPIMSGVDAAYNMDVIETHASRFAENYNKNAWHFAAAHEVGHIINQDVSPSQMVRRMQQPTSHQMEIEADFMATILHGDIKGQAEWRKSLPAFESTLDTPNHALRSKYLERWESWLESQGIAKDGMIVDAERALEVFPRAFHLLKGQLAQVGRHFAA